MIRATCNSRATETALGRQGRGVAHPPTALPPCIRLAAKMRHPQARPRLHPLPTAWCARAVFLALAGCLVLWASLGQELACAWADDRVPTAEAAAPQPPADAASGSPVELVLLPAEFAMTFPLARQQLVLELRRDGRFVGEAVGDVQWQTSDPSVVEVVDGIAEPRGNGEAVITARLGEREGHARVSVTGYDRPFAWSFRNHVESVLAKAGCSSGACHGAQAGKNGFRLSLRGYDPEADYLAITRQARGRRVVPSDPGRSLLLTKPSGAVPHRGGLRFKPGSREYQVIAEWIAAGTPPPQADDPRLDRLEVVPSAVVLSLGARQQFLVLAHFTDGHVEDVTRWAKYTSANESVAMVSDDGRVSVVGHGEGAITAWYASQVVTGTVSVPYAQPVPADAYAVLPARNVIDDLVLKRLRALQLPPSPTASDHEFLRRAYVDTIGLLPTADEARAFLDDPSPDKRDRLIESLLARPEFVDYWAYKWSELLLVNSERLPQSAMWSFYTWIRNHVQANTPWDAMVREIITAQGSTLENGAACFYLLHQDPLDMTETTTVAFLGMSVNCARCHNHPLEKWTNNQYYGLANHFARVRLKSLPNGAAQVFVAPQGDLIQPNTGQVRPPTPLDGTPLDPHDPGDRRQHLAQWLTSPQNPYFSRAIVNRVWANFMGPGLVEPVDDMRLTNPPSNPELLEALSSYLVEQGFDLKALMRLILQSSTYQRTSQPLPENAADERFYSHYYPRRLMAEVLLDAMSQVTGVPTQLGDYPLGWRALQLPDSNVESYFLKTFGRPDRVITCECERTSDPSMVQVLHLANGRSLNEKLQAAGNRLEQQLAAGWPPERLVEEAYLAALARRPTAEEQASILEIFSATPPQEWRLLLEDLYWGILSSREFLFNH